MRTGYCTRTAVLPALLDRYRVSSAKTVYYYSYEQRRLRHHYQEIAGIRTRSVNMKAMELLHSRDYTE
ncbi:hypothetical protein HA466_0043260 [Hirschfeldia incana]|nr:hypothetical protein HA466_0043260 [Hirschfeldia incana]